MLELYDYDLPAELIAQTPAPERDGSRLLVLDRDRRSFVKRRFPDLREFLRAGDVLVVNDARVFPARVRLSRSGGGSAELLLLAPFRGRPAPHAVRFAGDDNSGDDDSGDDGHWEAIIRPARWARRFLEQSEPVELPAGRGLPVDAVSATVRLVSELGEGRFEIVVERGGDRLSSRDVIAMCESIGEPPLPPYIKRSPTGDDLNLDSKRYQTVYAQNPVAVAAPTAGLHFTDALLEEIAVDGIEIIRITHQVGIGTFLPLRGGDLAASELHAEISQIDADAGARILDAKSAGRRIIAVGTTTVRALESFALAGTPVPYRKSTRLFIKPGHRFRLVDVLVTNFHLPQSSLLVLVSAFAGRELVLESYRFAVAERFRFYSYGDAMLII